MKLSYRSTKLPLILTFIYSLKTTEATPTSNYYPIYKVLWGQSTLNAPQRVGVCAPTLLIDLFGEASDVENSDDEGFEELIQTNLLNTHETSVWKNEEIDTWADFDLDEWLDVDETSLLGIESPRHITLDLPTDLDPDSTNFNKWWYIESKKLSNDTHVTASSTCHTNLNSYRVTASATNLLLLHVNFNKQVPMTSKTLIRSEIKTSRVLTTRRRLQYSLKLNQIISFYVTSFTSPKLLLTSVWLSYVQLVVNLLQSNAQNPANGLNLNIRQNEVFLLKSFNKEFM